MGWDAYGSAERHFDHNTEKYCLVDKEIEKDFLKAHFEIIKLAGSVDGSLSFASLDVSTCGQMLSLATGESVYNDDGWNFEKVIILASSANWNFEYDKKDYWAYLSACAFLKLCAEHELSITFSY